MYQIQFNVRRLVATILRRPMTITQQDARYILAQAASGRNFKQLASDYRVSPMYIRNILNGNLHQ